MTVHMVRVFIELPKGEAESAVDNWVTNFTEWADDPTDHTLTEINGDDPDATTYVRGDYRFIQGTNKTTLLDHLSEILKNIEGGLWHRLAYHVCSHDEDEPKSCSWDQVVEYGSIPSDIPTVKVN
jgi:hypothetical protein